LACQPQVERSGAERLRRELLLEAIKEPAINGSCWQRLGESGGGLGASDGRGGDAMNVSASCQQFDGLRQRSRLRWSGGRQTRQFGRHLIGRSGCAEIGGRLYTPPATREIARHEDLTAKDAKSAKEESI
jgi:hypothetical protein